MKQIEYYVKTLAPVSFVEKNNDATLFATKTYIPSSAIRGQLIESYLATNGKEPQQDPLFKELFMSGKVRILPAYPIHEVLKKERAEAFVLPLSMVKDKITNEIFDNAAQNAPKPRAGLKKWSGFANFKGTKVFGIEVTTQAQLHMQRTSGENRILGYSDDGAIFNYEYIEPHQYFKGIIQVEDEQLPKFEKFLKKDVPKIIYLGHSRKAQYGSSKCNFYSAKNYAPVEFMETDNLYLYARTPYVPIYSWQNISCEISKLLDNLARDLEQQGITVKLSLKKDKIWAAQEEINGYVTVWQGRYERAYGISAGSLFGIEIEPATPDVLKALQYTLVKGWGQRRAEGYGQFILWQPQEKYDFDLPGKHEKKIDKLSDIVKTKAKEIIKERVLRELAVEGNNTTMAKDEVGKHILKRLEILMSSDLSKEEIKRELEALRDIAIFNLRKIILQNKQGTMDNNLLEHLMEIDGAEPAYRSINWVNRLGLDKEKADKLKKELNIKDFLWDEDMAYKHYWFWVFRHGSKK